MNIGIDRGIYISINHYIYIYLSLFSQVLIVADVEKFCSVVRIMDSVSSRSQNAARRFTFLASRQRKRHHPYRKNDKKRAVRPKPHRSSDRSLRGTLPRGCQHLAVLRIPLDDLHRLVPCFVVVGTVGVVGNPLIDPGCYRLTGELGDG
jgi:hypothetical protein